MRTRSVLTYGDIRSQLDRVTMPEGFPVARFDDNEILLKDLLTHDDHQEVTLEVAFEDQDSADELSCTATDITQQPSRHSKHVADHEESEAMHHTKLHRLSA